mgnify:FL=1
MKIRDFILSLVSWFILLVTVSCSDELGGERAPISSESNLHVLVPTVLSSRGTRTDDASGLPTYNATVDECQINDLTLYAFPVNNDGKLLKETLPAPLATMMVEQHVANYQLTIEPGTYHIYVVANMNKVLSGQTIQTEDDLKKIVLDYRPTSTTGMPVCTNIPMIYEPEKDAEGNLAETEIKAAGDKYTVVAANLKFTCVKVKLNLIFDPSNAEVATNFGGKPFSINSISADKLSPFTHLYWGGKFETPTWEDNAYNKIYKDGIKSTPYEASSRAAVYYTDWTDNRSASATNNNDDIKGTGRATENPVNPAGKWLFQQTYYLPERYISSESDRSYLTINGKVGDYADNNYRIDLGHKKDGTSATEVPVFPRGTFYEITGAIKTLGNMELDCKVSVKPWETVPIDADFNHTTLWVSKTEANVTSMKNDYITYNSNAGTVGFGCDNKIDSKDIIIGTKRGKDANGNDSIEFRLNPNIPIIDYAKDQLKGTAKFWIKANNLKKYIDVNYDVTPYLDVTKKVVIYYNKNDESQNSRSIEWDTNLGGIKLEKTTLKKGKSTIEMDLNPSDEAKATGVFTVTAKTDPVTTTIYELKVIPQNEKTDVKYKTVRVIVRPPIGDYRIYFRAINDRSKYNGGNSSDNFKKILPEGGEEGKNNWSDGWNENAEDTSVPTTKNHYIYVYTQIGETEDAVTGKGWIFTEGTARNGWPGEEMVADETNTGWYYKNFPENAQNVSYTNGADKEGPRTIKPGETLIMFSNNTYLDQGYSLHRCPHHLEPGIPLFDYEDREGWIVYDPTSDPIWHVYDNMPEIEDIEYKVYTPFELFGWYKVYGIAGSGQFKIWDTAKNSWECKNLGNGWYKTTIKLKAVKGEHEKNILLKEGNNDNSPTITLFNGNSFNDDTGYYEGGKWYQGKPKGVTE